MGRALDQQMYFDLLRASRVVWLLAVLGLPPAAAASTEGNPVPAPPAATAPVSRILVGLRPPAATVDGPADGRVQALAWRSGLDLRRQ